MSGMLPDRAGAADRDARLDAWLSETWEAAAEAVGRVLDLSAGKEALLGSCGLPPDRPAELRALAGINRRAPRRRHRRRLGLGWAAGVAAALAAGAVAIVAVAMPGEGNGKGTSVIDTAYVVKRVDNALNAAQRNEIVQMKITNRGPDGTATGELWSHGGQSREITNSPSGHPAYDQGLSPGAVWTVVSYPMHGWARHHQERSGRSAASLISPGNCSLGLAALPLLTGKVLRLTDFAPATVVSNLRAAISCGILTVAGRQRVDGINAIKLTSRPDSPLPNAIWVSPGTFLPVRVVATWQAGIGVLHQTTDISWLRPTAQNLAMLTVPVPAGFRQVPFQQILAELRTR